MSLRVFITGGSRGIGRAIAEKYSKEGHEVIAPTRTELDLMSDGSIEAYVRKNSGLEFDVIINNAGINNLAAIDDIKTKELEEMLRINVVAPIMLLSGFCSSLRKKKISWIVNISSIWAIVAKEKRLQYAVTKHGINGVTRTLAVELGHNNILVNSVCPGYVLTEMTRKNVAAADKKAIESFIPLKRMAQPSEVAEVVYFLASPQNTYLTGQIITVDGGYTAK